MKILVMDIKSDGLVTIKICQALQKKAALKTKSEKVLSIDEARTRSKKLIRISAGIK